MSPRITRITRIIAGMALLILLGCAQGGNSNIEIDSDIPDGMGRVVIKLSDTVGRTIIPSTPALTHFKVIRVKIGPNATPVHDAYYAFNSATSTSLAPISVPAATYEVTVEAFTTAGSAADLSDSTGLAARYTDPAFVVNANTSNTLNANLKMLLGEAGTTGTFTWAVTLPASPPSTLNITKAELTINTLAGGKVGSEENLLSSGTGTRTPLDSGMYNVVVELVHTENFGSTATNFDRSVIVWHEILHIYSTLTSNWTHIFLDSHFSMKSHIVTFDHNYTPSKPADLKQSVLYGGTIGTMPEPSRDGHLIEGWYTDPTPANGIKWLGTGAGFEIFDDMTLYANWILDTTVVVNIAVDPITDSGVILEDGSGYSLSGIINISRSGTPSSSPPRYFEIVINNHSDFSSYKWAVAGVGINAGSDYEVTTMNFELDAAEEFYNSLGRHLLRLTLVKGSGAGAVTYQVNIPFMIVP